MFKQVFAQFDAPIWPSIALLLFFAVMCGSFLWVYRRGSKEIYKATSNLPLIDDNFKEDSKNER